MMRIKILSHVSNIFQISIKEGREGGREREDLSFLLSLWLLQPLHEVYTAKITLFSL